MKIAIGNDHAGVDLKFKVMEYLEELGYDIINIGTDDNERIDYPYISKRVANKVLVKEADLGVLICGTGVGVSIAANKIKGIRAVVCSEPFSAKMGKAHNDCNVLCFGARVVGEGMAKMILDEWLKADFEGGRHKRRINDLE